MYSKQHNVSKRNKQCDLHSERSFSALSPWNESLRETRKAKEIVERPTSSASERSSAVSSIYYQTEDQDKNSPLQIKIDENGNRCEIFNDITVGIEKKDVERVLKTSLHKVMEAREETVKAIQDEQSQKERFFVQFIKKFIPKVKEAELAVIDEQTLRRILQQFNYNYDTLWNLRNEIWNSSSKKLATIRQQDQVVDELRSVNNQIAELKESLSKSSTLTRDDGNREMNELLEKKRKLNEELLRSRILMIRKEEQADRPDIDLLEQKKKILSEKKMLIEKANQEFEKFKQEYKEMEIKWIKMREQMRQDIVQFSRNSEARIQKIHDIIEALRRKKFDLTNELKDSKKSEQLKKQIEEQTKTIDKQIREWKIQIQLEYESAKSIASKLKD